MIYACDSMSMLNYSLASKSRNPLRKIYNSEVARRYFRYERAYYPSYDAVIFVGDRDAAYVGLPPPASVSVIGNGVDTESFRPAPQGSVPSDPPRVLFHGSFHYVANLAAIRYLADQVGLDLERELGPKGFELRLIGGNPGPNLRAKLGRKPWAKLVGYVDDLGTEFSTGPSTRRPFPWGGV